MKANIAVATSPGSSSGKTTSRRIAQPAGAVHRGRLLQLPGMAAT